VRVSCRVGDTCLPGDYADVDGVAATCTRCGHAEEAYGTSGASVRSCLARMRGSCPRGEKNYYAAEPKES
jgi:hypothetical protein